MARKQKDPIGLPTMPRKPSLPSVPRPPIMTRGPKVLQAALLHTERTDAPGPVPPGLIATEPEWAIYWALLRLGYKPGVDFDFQSSQLGGRLERGGMVLDFIITEPLGLAINVEGEYWHYGHGSDKRAKDRAQRIQAASLGLFVVYVDERDARANPIYYTREALAGIDHSRMDEM